MKLYDSAFSPFARKIRLVLDYKGLTYEVVNGLHKANHQELQTLNSRIEVPVLKDDRTVVSNSCHIVAYLEHAYPDVPVYPSNPAVRARALEWEKMADTILDSILVDISYWGWAERPDSMPEGLLDKARADLDILYDALDHELKERDYLCGDLSIADFACFPHLTAVKALQVPVMPEKHPRLCDWMTRMTALEICQADIARLKQFFKSGDITGGERQKIFWRGDRIEWMLASGYHQWFIKEIEEDRVLWPGLCVPVKRA